MKTIKKDSETTKVVFRKYPDGDILALFPYEKERQYHCSCYQHVGQHGIADYQHCISKTKPANESEYQDLKKELESIGYNLKVIKKFTN